MLVMLCFVWIFEGRMLLFLVYEIFLLNSVLGSLLILRRLEIEKY